jgi:hypothetical protein
MMVWLHFFLLLLLDASFKPGTSWLKIFNQEATMETSGLVTFYIGDNGLFIVVF